jgi:hypothetical protein
MEQLHLQQQQQDRLMKATFIATASAGEKHKIASFTATASGQDMLQLHRQQQQQDRTGHVTTTLTATTTGQKM